MLSGAVNLGPVEIDLIGSFDIYHMLIRLVSSYE